MQHGRGFECINRGCRVPAARVRRMNTKTLARQLSERVIEPFAHACGAIAIVTRVGLPALEHDQEVPHNPSHPLCAKQALSDYCRESWQLHLAKLQSHPQSHWHRCRFRRLCAVVPIVCQKRCIAATKLVCPSEESDERFAHLVTVLDALVRDYVAAEAESLQELCYENPLSESYSPPSSEGSKCREGDASPSLIWQAMRYVEENLSDPQLTVRRVAEALGVSANYLSNHFSNHVGSRLGRLIIEQRVKRAEKLLVTTGLQIKQIARDAGFAN